MEDTRVGSPAELGWRDLIAQGPWRGSVLVVDDDPRIREALKKAVAHLGHEVKVAASAEEADHWISAARFDVVLLDIELPRMNGIEFLEWALARDPALAIIMLTGLDDPDLALRCLDAGARTYLVKPIDLAFLERALRDALMARTLLVERNRLAAGGG